MTTTITIAINGDDNGLVDFYNILKTAAKYAGMIPEAEVIIKHNFDVLASVMYDIDMHDWDHYDFMIDSIAYTFYRNNLVNFVDNDFNIIKLHKLLSNV